MKLESSSPWTRAAMAKTAGVGPETLRFYEKKGLLGKPARNAVGHRIYGGTDLERMRFISRAQGLGFSLADIAQLLALTGNIRTPRWKVREIAGTRLTEIQEKIRDLQAMERALGGLVAQCDGEGALRGCPIAEFVSGGNLKSKGTCHEGLL
ncbi:MAG: MerR family DNA-binding protein [Verrucomicrobiota bacterium]